MVDFGEEKGLEWGWEEEGVIGLDGVGKVLIECL